MGNEQPKLASRIGVAAVRLPDVRAEAERELEWFVHVEGTEDCNHAWLPHYLGLGYWAQRCTQCGRTIEQKVPGYNCPEEDANG